jgi:hypothetical protein
MADPVPGSASPGLNNGWVPQCFGQSTARQLGRGSHHLGSRKAKRSSHAFGFRTGDIIKAVVPSGKPQGTHVGKVAIKARGQFTITTRERAVPDVPHRYCRRVHQADEYTYQKGERAFLPIP